MSTLLGQIIADFRTSLAVAIAIGGTTGTLQSATDDDGVAIPAGTYYFTLDGDNSQKEHIIATLSGTSLTAIKSVSRQGVQTSGTVRSHRIGSSAVITDFGHIKYMNDLLSGTTSFNSAVKLGYDGDPGIISTDNYKFATVQWVASTAIAGGVDAATTVKGITKLSAAPVSATNPIAAGDNDTRIPTQAENDALVGTSGAPSSSNKYVTNADTSTVAVAGAVVRATSGSKIAEGYLQMTDVAATTLTAGSTSDASAYHTHNFSKLVTATTAVITGASRTDEFAIFATTAISAGSLTTGRVLRARIHNTFGVNTSATATFRLYYGGSVLATNSIGPGGGSNTGVNGVLEALIYAVSNSSQAASMLYNGNKGGINVDAGTSGEAGDLDSGTASIDATVSQNFVITIQFSGSSANSNITTYFATLELLK